MPNDGTVVVKASIATRGDGCCSQRRAAEQDARCLFLQWHILKLTHIAPPVRIEKPQLSVLSTGFYLFFKKSQWSNLWLPWINSVWHQNSTLEICIPGFLPLPLRVSRRIKEVKSKLALIPTLSSSTPQSERNPWTVGTTSVFSSSTEQTAPVTAVRIYSCSAPLKKNNSCNNNNVHQSNHSIVVINYIVSWRLIYLLCSGTVII